MSVLTVNIRTCIEVAAVAVVLACDVCRCYGWDYSGSKKAR